MKAMICEMCGGRDLVKQDGVYVCQNCGCKYSTEEARKLFEVTGKVEVDGISTRDQLLERGNTYLKLEDYEAAQKTFSEFINTYPEKRVGYEKYITAISRNFKRDFINDSSSLGSESELNNAISKLKRTDDNRNTKEAQLFIEKIDKYLNWLELSKQLEEKKGNLSEITEHNMFLLQQISKNKSTTKYNITFSIILFIFGFHMLSCEMIDFAIGAFGSGAFFLLREIIINNDNKDCLKVIDANQIQIQKIQKEIETINNNLNKIKIN